MLSKRERTLIVMIVKIYTDSSSKETIITNNHPKNLRFSLSVFFPNLCPSLSITVIKFCTLSCSAVSIWRRLCIFIFPDAWLN